MWRCEKLDGVRFNYPTEKLAKWYVLLVHPGFHPPPLHHLCTLRNLPAWFIASWPNQFFQHVACTI